MEEVAEAAVVVEPSGEVTLRYVLLLEALVGARGDVRRIWRTLRESGDDRILPGPVGRRVVAERQTLGRIEVAGEKDAAHLDHVPLVLHLIGVDIGEQRVADEGESRCGAELAAITLAVIERNLR